MLGGKRRLVTLLVAVAAIGVLVTPVSAHPMTKTDGNDTAGPLDLAKVSVTHDALSAKFRFETYAPWPAWTVRGDNYLLIAIDRNEDLTADRCLFIYYYGGKLRGVLTNCRRISYGAMPVKKPAGKVATISTGITALGGTHLWAAYSLYSEKKPCLKGCVDVVPNRVPLLHDLVPPTPSWTTTSTSPFLSTSLSSTTTIPLGFELLDEDTRVADWRIDRIENVFTGASSTFLTGVAPADGTEFVATEGETYVLQLSATDLHGNVGTGSGVLQLGVPYDDGNAIIEYEGSWTQTPNASYFGGGYHVTASVDDTLTITFTSSSFMGSQTHVYFLGGPGNGTALWTDGVSNNSIVETPSTPVGAVIAGNSYPRDTTKTLTLTVTSGTMIIDGIAVVMA